VFLIGHNPSLFPFLKKKKSYIGDLKMKRCSQIKQYRRVEPKEPGFEQIKFNSEFINMFSRILFSTLKKKMMLLQFGTDLGINWEKSIYSFQNE
jgi:hypothetical protein